MTDIPNFKDALDAFQRGDLERAQTLAHQSVASGVTSAEVEHLLGLICCRLGNPAVGAMHFEKAADAEPTNARHLIMLSRAFVDSGRAADALELRKPNAQDGAAAVALWHARAEAALATNEVEAAAEAWGAFVEERANDWRGWANYGDALAKLERWGEAAAALGKAVQLNSGDVGLRRNLAVALASGGWLEESATEFKGVIALNLGDTECVVALARVQSDLRKYEDALETLEKAERRGLRSGDVEKLRGHCLVSLRRFDEAEHLYRSILERSPKDSTAVHELGLIFERSNRLEEAIQFIEWADRVGVDEAALTYLRAAVAFREQRPRDALDLLENRPTVAEPVHMRRLKARAADALGESGSAFAAAEAMNRGFDGYDGWRAAGASYRTELRDLAAAITPAWAKRIVPLPAAQRRSPAFLVGFPRSGTTLLDTFLFGHPRTAVLEEKRLVAAAERVVGRIAEIPDQAPAVLTRARTAYFEELSKHVDPGFAGLVVDKLPFNMLGAPLIHAMFPDAHFIFAQRHPCDAVLSGFMQSFTPNEAMASFLDIGDAADLYDAAMHVWTRSHEMLPLRVHTVVYEQLVRTPEQVLGPLIDFLELEWHEELLDHRSTAFGRSAIPTPSYDQVIQPLNETAIGRWRRYEKQLAPVLPVLLPWAERLGYPS